MPIWGKIWPIWSREEQIQSDSWEQEEEEDQQEDE